MKHYTLFKLKPGADVMAAQHTVWQAYRAMDDALDWMNRPVIYRSCEASGADFDLMGVFELDGEEQLSLCLEHPIHQKLIEDLRPVVDGQWTFDHY